MSVDEPFASSPSSPAGAPSGIPLRHGGVNVPEVPSHLLWAVLSTLLCCQVTGVVSIIYASLVQGRLGSGDVEGAFDASRKAWIWAVAGPVLWVVAMMIFGGVAFLGSLLE